ncbi:MAG: 3-dehydroquinate synthase [Oscillospiraceae bacterium]
MVIKVNTAVPYGIVIERGALDKIGPVVGTMFKGGTKVMVISDTNVYPRYGRRVLDSLEGTGFSPAHFVFPAGEEQKNMDTIMEMYKALAEKQFSRSDLIIALGGGVVGDMAGFAAATYLRGIDYIQVPTSLLAQVDSSVGGKTGVDLAYGKNLVGAFHQPRAVITDPDVLKTLPREYFIDGMGEVVKYGCIADKQLFEDLESGAAVKNIDETIFKCVDCKRRLVEEDALDTGRRMILNFGHTFGHALEKLHDFKGLSHGRAVAIGMCIATKMSESLHLTADGTYQRLWMLLKKLGLPIEDNFSLEEVVDATMLDKKSAGKFINLIFISEIGTAFVHQAERNYLILRYKILEEKQARNGKSTVQ